MVRGRNYSLAALMGLVALCAVGFASIRDPALLAALTGAGLLAYGAFLFQRWKQLSLFGVLVLIAGAIIVMLLWQTRIGSLILSLAVLAGIVVYTFHEPQTSLSGWCLESIRIILLAVLVLSSFVLLLCVIGEVVGQR